MPQYLIIVVGGATIAQMKTSHRNGSRYDIYWTSIQGCQREFPDIDKGVECQPSVGNAHERTQDFRNDFIHARRAISAASSTAKRFLDDLNYRVQTDKKTIETVQIVLKTNCYDRGRITIVPNDDQEATLTMEIGTGPCRPRRAIPVQAKSFTKDGINILGVNSSIAMASHVFDSECTWMLNKLEKNT
jgi:hypothetical protein